MAKVSIQDLRRAATYWLVLLKWDISPAQDFTSIWNNAVGIVCADGALNKLHTYCTSNPDLCPLASRLPDVILGDLDTVDAASLEWMQSVCGTQSVPVIKYDDQDTTDFEKALNYVYDHGGREVIGMNALEGRVDLTFSQIDAILRTQCDVQLMNPSSWTRIIKAPEVAIDTSGFIGSHCGIIPAYGAVTYKSSTGLHWALDDLTLELGRLVSASNIITAPEVTLERQDGSDTPYLWTCDY